MKNKDTEENVLLTTQQINELKMWAKFLSVKLKKTKLKEERKKIRKTLVETYKKLIKDINNKKRIRELENSKKRFLKEQDNK